MKKREIIISNIKKKVIIITGQNQSGKSLLTRLVTSFGKSDIFTIDYFLESLSSFYKLKKINKQTFKELINFYINQLLINKTIGRNLNLKRNEETSIWQTSRANFFIKKIIENYSKKKTINKIKKENEIIILLHDAMSYLDLVFYSFKDVKIINIAGNSADQVYSLYNKKTYLYAENNFKDNLASDIRYIYKGKINSIYGLGWEKKFRSLNKIEKLINIKSRLDLSEKRQISKNKLNKKKILSIKYDDLLNKSNETTSKIAKFLEKRISPLTNKILLSSDFLSRKKFIEKRPERIKFIISKIKKNKLDLMNKIITKK